MNIHFVYPCRPNLTFLSKVKGRTIKKIQNLGLPISYVGKRNEVITDNWDFSAPTSITHHMYKALKKNFPNTFLYDWEEKLLIKGGSEDILIGHPFPGDNSRVWNNSCLKGEFAARIAFTPIHHRMAEFCQKYEQFIPHVDAIFGITGPFWWDTWHESVFAHWKSKILPIDMAVNTDYYPFLKRKFNPQGKRKFLFIGNGEAYKGVHLISILFGLSSHHECVWIGADRKIPNIDCRPFTALTSNFIKKMAEECDFFITMGVSDANPTTILEAMAWGFPVCCTPQSGYYNMPQIYSLSIDDMKHNLNILNKLQAMSDQELIENAIAARELVSNFYTWERFTSNVIQGIQNVIQKM